jgi:hypothetical protein
MLSIGTPLRLMIVHLVLLADHRGVKATIVLMKQRGVRFRDYLQGVQLPTVSLKQIDLAVRTFERLEQKA